jgi:CubicO group peptidase (beta-lactamase class C family)
MKKSILIPAFLVASGVGCAQVTFPAKEWSRSKPEDVGYASPKLEALRGWLKTQKTTAIHVSVDGRLIFEYGDTAFVSKVASVRKSILAMMYGNYVASGKADLGKTVEQLGLEEAEPFLAIERNATLLHLLTARSGIYMPSGNEELTSASPRRGAQAPGSYMQYQNWDFNAAGTAFEKISGKDIFAALEAEVAVPIGMQDFDPKKQHKVVKPDSVHAEYAMYLSTRDMARLGLLMLADGSWGEKQVMPKGWAGRITTLVTPHSEMHPVQLAMRTRTGLWGYGMLWWIWDAPSWPQITTGPLQGAYTAMGSFGQYITVLPAMRMVIAHKVDFEKDGTPQVTPGEFHAILQMLLEAGLSQ